MLEHQKAYSAVLEKIKLTIRSSISKNAIRDLDFPLKLTSEETAHEMIYRLEAILLGREVIRIRCHVEYPKNWWEAFKERWFPLWLRKRYPIKYNVINLDEPKYAICPYLPNTSVDEQIRWLQEYQET